MHRSSAMRYRWKSIQPIHFRSATNRLQRQPDGNSFHMAVTERHQPGREWIPGSDCSRWYWFVNLSGTVNLWCYDPENCCSPRSAAQFDFGQINYYQCVLFPIILDYIRIQNGSLVWQTSMEQNVSYYQVQGAIEHGTWQNIARVPAKGASIYSYRINDIQAALEPILALLFLGALLYRKKFQILAIAMLVIAAHCTKDNQTVQPPAMKYFRIQEFDIGKPLPVWNSEVVPL
jgi:hypothetical protein